MPAWPAKDPDSTYDYRYIVPLDGSDTVATAVLTVLAGTVIIDSQIADDTGLNVTLSGGTHGETAVFKVAWTTVAGRADDDAVTLAVETKQPPDLVLTGYVKPLAAHLVTRYPAFASTPIQTIRYWLADAERFVDTSWPEGDYAAALMAVAAHHMAAGGVLAGTGIIPAGVLSFKSASFAATVSETAANAAIKGGWASTPYGRDFAAMQRRIFGGPRIVSAA